RPPRPRQPFPTRRSSDLSPGTRSDSLHRSPGRFNMSDNLFDRQHAALSGLAAAARDRATAEAELTATFEAAGEKAEREVARAAADRKSTRLNSSHDQTSY